MAYRPPPPARDAGPLNGACGAGEKTPIWTWQADLRTGEMSHPAAFALSLGLAADTALTVGMIAAMVHPDDQDRREAAFAQALATGEDYAGEYRLVRPDGGVVWHHVRAQLVLAADGTALALNGISFDITQRRNAEHRLELSEESQRLAADAAELGTWDLDLQTNELTWSARTYAMFGVSPDVPISLADFYGGLHPEDYAATTAAFASALDPAIRATYDVEYRTIGREDGVVRWVAAKGKGLFIGNVCRRAIGTAIDITARKSEALRQAFLLDLLDQLQTLTEPVEIAATAGRALGGFLGAHRVGYARVQPDDATVVLETCHVDGVAALAGTVLLDDFGAAAIARQRRGETVVCNDIAADAAENQAAWAAIETRAYISVPLVRDGRLRATMFVNQREARVWAPGDVALIENVAGRLWDTLERARAEEALRLLNASLERQVERRTRALDRTWRLAPVLMLVGKPDGTLLDANPAWTNTLGWRADETIGQNVMEFVAPEDRMASAAGMQHLAAGNPLADYHTVFLTRDGQRRQIAWTTVPEGNRLYAYGRDVTDQMLAEDRLRQAQKMEAVGQLTGGLAHDFNNLLAGITGSLEMLRMRIGQGRAAEIERYAAAAQTAAGRAASLTQRLLAFSRQQTLDPRPTDVNALIASMEDMIRRTVGPALDVVVVPLAELWPALVDAHQLENTLLNLCINARDAMPDGGRLTIATAHHAFAEAEAVALDISPGQYLSLAVTDTGTGMTPDVLRRAFDPFFTTKPLGGGTGLGLSMIYGFVRQSGGQVRIASALGQGTTVRVYLPRCSGNVARLPAEPPAAAAPRAQMGETVLVVDDEAVIRTLVAEVLGDLGYDAIEAEDGASGLRILQSDTVVDLLVTDVGLPGGMNGRQLADAARARRPGLPVLFITGYAENAAVSGHQLEPGMQVLTKPFTLEVLAARIRGMLG